MRARIRTIGILCLAACLAATLAATAPSRAAAATDPATGGTLRVGLSRWALDGAPDVALDPQTLYFAGGFALLQCCLTRTLMGYPDVPVSQGGGDLLPDLAADYPTVSLDGLTWTFHLRQGLHYAPPLEDTEITAADIRRGIERVAHIGSLVAPYFAPIEGFEAMLFGDASTVSGLVTPDPYTLEVHLTEPVGDLGERLSLTAAAPIAPFGNRPLGTAQGYDAFVYGAHAVSSGPYMFEGSPELDFSELGDESPALYTRQDTRWTWVRNPSWDASTDPLRAALPDRIEFEVTTGTADSQQSLDSHNDEVVEWVREGSVDMAMSQLGHGMTTQARASWSEDPEWNPRIVPALSPGELFVVLRLPVPPFDDLHVRRAVALALDRRGYLIRQHDSATSQTHLTLDPLTENILSGYDPYPGSDTAGAAREMARSSYDADHDGRCDADVCRDVIFACGCTPAERALVEPLAAIGIDVVFRTKTGSLIFPDDTTTGLTNFRWVYDWQDAYTLFGPLLASGSLSQSMIGERPRLLRDLGFPRTRVPSLDADIDACQALAGPARAWCWARLDQYEMEEIVSLLPLGQQVLYWASGPNVTTFGLSWFGQPALDRMVVEAAA